MKKELKKLGVPERERKGKYNTELFGINSLVFKLFIVENAYTFVGVNEIPLDATGLVSVTGLNRDSRTISSNGTGKTTIWKCFLKLFYGRKVSKREKPSDAYNPEVWNYRLECHFHKDGHDYIARECKKHSEYEDGLHVFRDGKPWGVKNNPEMLRKELQGVLNRSYEEFIGTIIWRQNNDHALIDGTPAERSKWISDFFGLNVYDDLFDEFKDRHTHSKEKITELAEVDAKAKVLKTSMDSVGDIEVTRKRISKFRAKLDSYRAIMTENASKAEKLKEREVSLKQLAELKAELEEHAAIKSSGVLADKIDVSRKKIARLRASIEASSNAFDVIARYKKMKSRKEECADKLKVMQDEVAYKGDGLISPKEVKELLETTRSTCSELTSTCRIAKANAELNAKAKEALDELEELTFTKCSNKYLRNLRDGHVDAIKEHEKIIAQQEMVLERKELLDGHVTTCPTCGSSVDINALKTAIADAKKTIEASRSAVKQNTAEKKMYERALELRVIADSGTVRGNALDIKTTTERIDRLSKKIDRLESMRDVVEKYAGLNQDLKELKPRYLKCREAQQTSITALQAEIKVLETGLETMLVLHDKFKKYEDLASRFGVIDSVKAKMNTIRHSIRECDDARSEAEEQCNDLRVRIDRLEQAIVTYDQYKKEYDGLSDGLKSLKKWTRLERVYKALRKAYDKQGLKTKRLKELIDAIKTRLPVWTGILFTEKNFSIDATGNEKKIGFEVTQTKSIVKAGKKSKIVKRFDASEASGSERTRISCALMLTMSDVASSEKQCNLLVLDELERGLDPLSRQIMSEEVIPLLKHKKPSLFLITHSLEVEPTVFDHELVITKQNQQSTTKFTQSRSNTTSKYGTVKTKTKKAKS